MKHEKNTERLSLLLGDLDPALLEEAYRADTPEKLKGGVLRNPKSYRRTIFPRLAVATVSIVLTLTLFLGLFILLRPGDAGVDLPEESSGHVTDIPEPGAILPPWRSGKLTLTSLTYAPQSNTLSTHPAPSFDRLREITTGAETQAETETHTEAFPPAAPIFGKGENVQVSIMDNTKISDYMGPDLIRVRPADGEHMNCSDVYHNIRTGEEVCMSCRILSAVQGTELYTDAAIQAFMTEFLLDHTYLQAAGEIREWQEIYSQNLSHPDARELFRQLEKPTTEKLHITKFFSDRHEAEVMENISDYQYPYVDVIEYGTDPELCLYSLRSPVTHRTYGSYVIRLTTGEATRIDAVNQSDSYPLYTGLNLPYALDVTILNGYQTVLVTLPYYVSHYESYSGHLIPAYSDNTVLLLDVKTGNYRELSRSSAGIFLPSAKAQAYEDVIFYPSGSLWCFYLTSTNTLYTVDGELARVAKAENGTLYAVMKQDSTYAFYPLRGENTSPTATEPLSETDLAVTERYVMEGCVRINVVTGEALSLWDGEPATMVSSRDGRYLYLYFTGADHILCLDVCTAEQGLLTLSDSFVQAAATAGEVEYRLLLSDSEEHLLMTYCKEGIVVFDTVGYENTNHYRDYLGGILDFYTVNGQKLNFTNKETAELMLEWLLALEDIDFYTHKHATGNSSSYRDLYPKIAEQLIPYMNVWAATAEIPQETLYTVLGDMNVEEFSDLKRGMDEMLANYYKDQRISTSYGYELDRALTYLAEDMAEGMMTYFCVTPTKEQLTAASAVFLPLLEKAIDENFHVSVHELNRLYSNCLTEICPIATGMTYDVFIKSAGFLAWEEKYVDIAPDGTVFDRSPYCAKTNAAGDVRFSLQKKPSKAYITSFLGKLDFVAGSMEITPIASLFNANAYSGGLQYGGILSFLHVGYDAEGNAFVVIDGYYAPIEGEAAEQFKRMHMQSEQHYVAREFFWY